MFRRSKSESPAPEPVATKVGGKGRPTPSRKEAEAAARARAKTPRTRKEIAAAQRVARAESSQRMRTAMKTGDERFLPPRDRGPMRRFVRDSVDSRFTFLDIIMPLMILTLVLSSIGSTAEIGTFLMLASLLMLVVDGFRIRFRLRRELAARFPGESTKGTTYYALSRALNPRFLRMPKPQVKVGQALPETYR